MSDLSYRFVSWFYENYHAAWSWINRLDRQEWMMLLFVGMVAGFFCMRGYGSRENY